ncbi:ATP-binding protein [Streptomyces sp. bgisy034]|uniref:ATP-binding protein n=1 Tax=Streptomyces sp. bgisy034 TaxID=3413774 RepID=UPI003EB8F845
MPPRVAGATTAVRTPRAVLRCDGAVVNERFSVEPRCGDAPPRAEDARCVGVMRRVTAERLRYCGLDALMDDALTIVSELLTNAVLHSGTTEIRLTVTHQDDFLHIEVCDGQEGSIQPKSANDNDQSGRGLTIVEDLVQENDGTWGVSDDGTTVWCLLTVPQGGS